MVKKSSELLRQVKGLGARLRRLELWQNEINKVLEMGKPEIYVDPLTYAKDEFDKRLIKTLLLQRVATAPELARMIGEPDRFKVTKRLQRFQQESTTQGEQWLTFDPRNRLEHYRAWWIISDVISPKLLTPTPDAAAQKADLCGDVEPAPIIEQN